MSDSGGGPGVGGDHGHAPGHQAPGNARPGQRMWSRQPHKTFKNIFHENNFPKIKGNFLICHGQSIKFKL